MDTRDPTGALVSLKLRARRYLLLHFYALLHLLSHFYTLDTPLLNFTCHTLLYLESIGLSAPVHLPIGVHSTTCWRRAPRTASPRHRRGGPPTEDSLT
jgi:hypothetical protein